MASPYNPSNNSSLKFAKIKVYLRYIMERLYLPGDVRPMRNNLGNKANASSETTGKFLLGTKEHRTSWNDLGVPYKDRRRVDIHQKIMVT